MGCSSASWRRRARTGRPIESPRLSVEFVPPYYYVHKLRLEDVDDELKGWLAEAYQVGEQRHVSDPGWLRERNPPDWVRHG